MGLRDLLPYAFYVASILIVLWDVFLAGQIAQLRRAPRFFRGVTALAGLLVAPAILVAVTSASILHGRAIHVIAWVWPRWWTRASCSHLSRLTMKAHASRCWRRSVSSHRSSSRRASRRAATASRAVAEIGDCASTMARKSSPSTRPAPVSRTDAASPR